MESYLQNISTVPKMILKQFFEPGEKKDLSILFKEFSTDTPRKKAKFRPNEFSDFIEWVQELTNEQQGYWCVSLPVDKNKTVAKPKPKGKAKVKKTTKKKNPLEKIEKEIATLPLDQYKAMHIANLPYDIEGKRKIDVYENPDELRKAENICSNTAGKEKLRNYITKRLRQLESQGRYAKGALVPSA